MRLTGRDGGGFRLTGAGAPVEGTLESGALVIVSGERSFRFETEASGGCAVGGAIVISWPQDDPAAASSVLLEDGRLFRVAARGLSQPEVDVRRWDGIGPYLVARPEAGAWSMQPTAAGEAMAGFEEIVIAACCEIGRRDGWW